MKYSFIFENLGAIKIIIISNDKDSIVIHKRKWELYRSYLSVFTKLDGRGSPLRLIAEGGLRPEGFGIPVEPIVILVRAAAVLAVLVVDALFALGALIPIALLRL